MPSDRVRSSSPSKQRIDIGDTELYTVSRGTGPPIVFVHGSLADYRDWNSQTRELSDRFYTVTYSRRYHYPNDTESTQPYNAHTHAADLAALVTTLDIGPVNLVCNSYGAYIGLTLLHEQPELVESAVLNDPPLVPWLLNIPGGEQPLVSFLSETWLPAKTALNDGNREEAVRIFVDGVNGTGTYASLPEQLRDRMLDNIRDLELQMIASDRYPLFEQERLNAIDHPVLLLTGERSPDLFRLVVDRLAKVLGNAEVETISHASHAPHLQNMREFNRIIETFISQHTSA